MKKKINLKTKNLKASYTIEAAVVVPLTMLIILGAIRLALSVHEKVKETCGANYVTVNVEDKKARDELLLYKGICEGLEELTGTIGE